MVGWARQGHEVAQQWRLLVLNVKNNEPGFMCQELQRGSCSPQDGEIFCDSVGRQSCLLLSK